MSPLPSRIAESNPYVRVGLWATTSRCQDGLRGVVAGILFVLGSLAPLGCGHLPAVGRGGPVYDIAVESINGRKTAPSGAISYPACTIQVGDQVARVWLANADLGDDVISPTILRGDAEALKDGILVERSWSQAVVHHVTDDELAAGAAVVYVPGLPSPTVVELRFGVVDPGRLSSTRRTPRTRGGAGWRSGNRQHDLSKRGTGL